MKRGPTLAAVALAGATSLLAALAGATRQADKNQTACCRLVEQALALSKSIKPGMSRREIEKYFYEDGGAMPLEETRYDDRACSYIQIDVSFKLAAMPGRVGVSPDDIATKVSKPYLAYPAED